MLISYTAEELQEIEAIKSEFKEKILEETDTQNRGALRIQLAYALEAFSEKCQKIRFDEMGGDLDAIIQNAKEQIPTILELEYQEITKYTDKGCEDLEKIGVGTIEDDVFYINADFMGELIRNELKLHFEALQGDKQKTDEIIAYLIETLEKSPYTRNKDLLSENRAEDNIKYLVAKYPLVTLKNFGLPYDKVNQTLLYASDYFKQTLDGQYKAYWNIDQTKKGTKKAKNNNPVITYVSLTYMGNDPKYRTMRKLTTFDKAVFTTICNLYDAWEEMHPDEWFTVSAKQVWRVMTGKQSVNIFNPSPAQEERICKSIERMMATWIEMDITAELNANYLPSEFANQFENHVRGTYLLPADYLYSKTVKGRIVRTYRILEAPYLHQYEKAKNHIFKVDYRLLDTSNYISESEGVTEFKFYLLTEIAKMKSGFRNNCRILFSTLYTDTGILPPQERIEREMELNPNAPEKQRKLTPQSQRVVIYRTQKKDIEKIQALLTAWKDMKWINNFEIDKAGITINK